MILLTVNGKYTPEQKTTGGWDHTSKIDQYILQNAGNIAAVSV